MRYTPRPAPHSEVIVMHSKRVLVKIKVKKNKIKCMVDNIHYRGKCKFVLCEWIPEVFKSFI